jgi:hypothetical protein
LADFLALRFLLGSLWFRCAKGNNDFSTGGFGGRGVSDLRPFPRSITMSPLSHGTAAQACRSRKAIAQQQNGCALQLPHLLLKPLRDKAVGKVSGREKNIH